MENKENQNALQPNMLRNIWSRLFRYDWKFGLFLIILFAIPRFMWMINHNESGPNSGIFLMFLTMWFIPLIFLTSKGRKEIGIRKPTHSLRLLYAFILGGVFCLTSYFIASLLFGNSIDNCYIYMARTHAMPAEILEANRFKFFIISACVGMIFSPVGEELLFRGVIHGAFVNKFGENKASIIDSLAFAIMHLAHFGIIYDAGKWSFAFLPSLLWLFFMFMVSRLFFKCKQMCNSIWGATAAHAGFNLVMMYCTFYLIL